MVAASPFVGRTDERRALLGALERTVRDGRPAAAVVVGDPGVGKSRLLAEVVAGVDIEHKLRIGGYVIKNRSGAVRAQGTWHATRFISFLQLPGWWGIENFREEGWQGPPGSASFSGFLKLRVTLNGRGSGVLTLWCLMPEVPKPKGHVGDGLSFTGRGLRFTDFREQERRLEGVMFYSPGT